MIFPYVMNFHNISDTKFGAYCGAKHPTKVKSIATVRWDARKFAWRVPQTSRPLDGPDLA